MKKIMLVMTCSLSALSAFGQGAVFFGNGLTGFTAAVYGPDTSNPASMVVGQSSLDNPAGTTIFTGQLLQSGYDLSLFAGPDTAVSNQLLLVTTVPFRTATANVLPAGLIFSVNATIPGVPAGNTANFQYRVWDTEGGTVTDWNTAWARFVENDYSMQLGWTPVITSLPLGGTDSNNNVWGTPGFTGWQSFSLIEPPEAPEPSTIALAGLSAAGLLLFRRRK